MKRSQVTNIIVMSPPTYFGFNEETAASNVFQNDVTKNGATKNTIQQKAMEEYSNMIKLLSKHGITVLEIPNRTDIETPDAVFPNNWITHDTDGKLIIYPMLTKNRRAEKQKEKLIALLKKHDIPIVEVLDLSYLEEQNIFLESTGCLDLDRVHKVAFVMESQRASKQAINIWQEKTGYQTHILHGYDKNNLPIYHLNIAMNIGEGYTVCCTESITDEEEKNDLKQTLKDCDSELIDISMEQMYAFCGNIIHLKNAEGKRKIILSQQALQAFTENQKKRLEKYGELVPIDLLTIETVGGGSARCMIAEVFC